MTKNVEKLLKEKNQGIKLDIGCGANKQPGFVGMDIRALPGVDIVHNLEKYPWPLPDEAASLVTASHVLEHINPANTDPKIVGLIDLLLKKKLVSKKEIEGYIGEYELFGNFIRFMDEVWRVLKPGGQFAFVVPYAGSTGYWQDPTHLNPINEATITYFDPLHETGFWNIYKPKPWKIESMQGSEIGFFQVILSKRLIDKSYEPETK